MSVSLSNNF